MSAPPLTPGPQYRLATRPEFEVVHHERMMGWFDAGQLVRTGVKALLGTLFGEYADRREMQAALSRGGAEKEIVELDYSAHDEIWIDYAADVGDGWDSTYTIAWLLAQEQLDVEGGKWPTRRGSILILGGDQVYPTATREAYQHRFLDPYRSALPWLNTDRPHLYAVPGNHDWYDGLTSFLRLFCQPRSIGAWRTRQSRSYFALRLPHHWWLLAVDIQLESDLDLPQIEYFKTVLEQVESGDRIIMCTAESSWVDAGDPRAADNEPDNPDLRPHHNLRVLEDIIRQKKGDAIRLTLAGDLHHYSHYRRPDGSHHKFTAGGGGAYLLGTHQLPDRLELFEGRHAKELYELAECFPDKPTSRRRRWRTLTMVRLNVQFAAFVAGVYLLYSWLLQSASKVPNRHLCGDRKSLLECLAEVNYGDVRGWYEAVTAWYWVLAHSPESAVMTLLILYGLMRYCTRSPDAPKTWERWVWGGGHGLAHLALNFALFASIAVFNLNVVGPYFDSRPEDFVDHGLQVLLFGLEMIVAGGVLGGTLMGVYLVLSNAWARMHWDHVFSAQHDPEFKSFLRLHLTAKGITVHAIGIERVVKKWRFGRAVQQQGAITGKTSRFKVGREETAPWFEPDGAPPEPIMIEQVEIGG